MSSNRPRDRKPYEKPRVTYEKKVDVLAVVCSSVYVGAQACRSVRPLCKKLRT